MSGDKINYMLELRASGEDIVAPYAERYPEATFYPGRKPWEQKVDIALPCATQNELDGDDARQLIANGVKMVAEVSNMGCTPEAIDAFISSHTTYAPGKAVNAGGVATSGLEMSQNAMHLQWSAEEVDEKLHVIMRDIHEQCVKYGTEPDGFINYMKGANIAKLHEGGQCHDGAGRDLTRVYPSVSIFQDPVRRSRCTGSCMFWRCQTESIISELAESMADVSRLAR